MENQPNLLRGVGRVSIEVPALDGRIYRTSPVVKVREGSDRAAMSAVYDLNWLSATGTGLFLATVLAALWLRIGPRAFSRQFAQTLFRIRWAMFTIAAMLALAFVTKYSGADATLGLAFTHTGRLYPLFAPLLGWLGVAVTGSDTSANGAVRQPSADHSRTIAPQSPAHRCQQRHGRSDGKDDRRSDDRRCGCRRRPDGQRRADPPLRDRP